MLLLRRYDTAFLFRYIAHGLCSMTRLNLASRPESVFVVYHTPSILLPCLQNRLMLYLRITVVFVGAKISVMDQIILD